jgi:nucleolar protein 56
MEKALSQMDIADPSADVDSDEEMGDVAPRAVQKQEKQKRDKKDKKKKDKKVKALANGDVASKKRKHSELNGEAGGKKKKKKKSAIE